MLNPSELTERLLKSSVLPAGIKVSLNAIELYYARYTLLFPSEKFRDDAAFREYFSRVASGIADGLVAALRGIAFRVELYPSDRPFTVYAVLECLPDSAVTASSESLNHFKFFNVSGGGKTFSLPDARTLSIRDGEPVGWLITRNGTLSIKLPLENRIVDLVIDDSVSKWINSQDPSFEKSKKSQTPKGNST